MLWIYVILSILFGTLLAYLIYRKEKRKELPVKWLLVLLRGMVGFLVGLLLLAPIFSGLIKEEERPTVIWLQDISSSTKNSLGGFETQYQSQQKTLLEKLEKKYEVKKIGFGADIFKDSILNYTQKTTDISKALNAVQSRFQDKNVAAVILASDGIFNEGLDPRYLQFPEPLKIYTIALGDSTVPKDLSVVGVYSNKTVALKNQFEILVDWKATGLENQQTQASLIHNGKTIASENVNISETKQTSSLSFTVQADQIGSQKYSIVFTPLSEEKNTINNSRTIIVEVKERVTKVLLYAQAPHPDLGVIKTALKTASQFELTTIVDGSNPKNIGDFDILIAYQALPDEAIGIPTWFIGGNSNSAQFTTKLKQDFNANPSSVQEHVAQLNASFQSFSPPSGIQATLAKWPPISSSLALPKSKNATLLTNSNNGEALWVFQSGEKPQSLLNGEGIWKWAMYEFKNYRKSEVTYGLILQTLSFLTVEKDKKPFTIALVKNTINDNENAVITAELRSENGSLINEPEAKIRLQSGNQTIDYSMEKAGNGYRLETGILAPGEYNVQGTVTWNGRKYEDFGLLNVSDIPLEQIRTYADYDLMHQIARENKGHFFTQSNFSAISDSLAKDASIKTVIHSQSKTKNLIDYKWLFLLILSLIGAEWFLRKYWSLK